VLFYANEDVKVTGAAAIGTPAGPCARRSTYRTAAPNSTSSQSGGEQSPVRDGRVGRNLTVLPQHINSILLPTLACMRAPLLLSTTETMVVYDDFVRRVPLGRFDRFWSQ